VAGLAVWDEFKKGPKKSTPLTDQAKGSVIREDRGGRLIKGKLVQKFVQVRVDCSRREDYGFLFDVSREKGKESERGYGWWCKGALSTDLSQSK